MPKQSASRRPLSDPPERPKKTRRKTKKVSRKGRSPAREVAERRCIVSGQSLPKPRLIRFVVGPEERLVPDLAGKLPGRGIWVEATREALETAEKKKLYAKAARARVVVPEGLCEQVEQLLLERVQHHLGLAKRAGAITAGFDKVDALLGKKAPAALIEASDGAEDGRKKLVRLAKKHEKATGKAIKVVGLLNSEELSLAFGRQHVIHAALTAAPVADLAMSDLERLAGFRPMVPPAWSSSERPEIMEPPESMEPKVEN